MPPLYPVRVSGVSGGGWNGLAVRYEGWKTEFMSSADEEREAPDTKLASELERDVAVAAICDCRLFWLSGVELGGASGLVSVFRRRKMPDTAYETG
jgi:hypothetical protein